MRGLVDRNLSVEPKTRNFTNALKKIRYFSLSMAALILSILFPAIENQLLILALILGSRWIADGMDRKINILIK